MTIAVGEKLPEATLSADGRRTGPEAVALADKLKGRKVVIFGLPGAYTGTCTTAHVPSFIRTAPKFAAKGVDEIICVSVNDPFVMKAWGEATGATAAGITMLGDADAALHQGDRAWTFDVPPLGLHRPVEALCAAGRGWRGDGAAPGGKPGVCEISGGEALLAAI